MSDPSTSTPADLSFHAGIASHAGDVGSPQPCQSADPEDGPPLLGTHHGPAEGESPRGDAESKQSDDSGLDAGANVRGGGTLDAVQDGPSRLVELLAGLQANAASTAACGPPSVETGFENRLAMVRLGMATSLFYALRTKHAPTAAHSLRVALVCSAWCHRLGLSEDDRDRIEVAALLHDIGKIGIPDRILRKPGKLSVEEQLSMDACPEIGCNILRGCTSDTGLLETIQYANAWYESRRHGDSPRGDALPIGSRMLAIANAFDAMTSDHVYRPAMSRERSLQMLMQGSGTQFDPELVVDYSRMLEQRPELLHGSVVDRWLQQLKVESGNHLWQQGTSTTTTLPDALNREHLFYRQLTGHLHDGVVFTDTEGTITYWNATMERLTSISADAIVGRTWGDEMLRVRNEQSTDAQTREENGRVVGDSAKNACPVRECLRCGMIVARSMRIEHAGQDSTPVHLQVSPVIGDVPGIHGTVVIVRDLSDRASLEQRLESLHRKATLDSLTGVANRAEFDQTLADLTELSRAGGPSFSLIICDIDHFKRVNDVHGHPAGDEALVNFAQVLSAHGREGDLVARYGGEEFVLIAANCDNATAAKRAESIRQALARTPLPSLGGQAVTASFGVTEFQVGDSAETVLARADRALLRAKDNGRNRVVQLGSGKSFEELPPADRHSWFSWLGGSPRQQENEVNIVTPVPIDLAVEKLRGFIADHDAEILHVNENQLTLRVTSVYPVGGRRAVDHQIALNVHLTLSETQTVGLGGQAHRHRTQTSIHAALKPIRNRDRRSRELKGCIGQVVASLRSYLMGEIVRSPKA